MFSGRSRLALLFFTCMPQNAHVFDGLLDLSRSRSTGGGGRREGGGGRGRVCPSVRFSFSFRLLGILHSVSTIFSSHYYDVPQSHFFLLLLTSARRLTRSAARTFGTALNPRRCWNAAIHSSHNRSGTNISEESLQACFY